MLITIAAVGKLKAGPERELFDRYIDRANGAGRKLGLSFATRELADSRATSALLRRDQEAAAISSALAPGARARCPRRGRQESRQPRIRRADWQMA